MALQTNGDDGLSSIAHSICVHIFGRKGIAKGEYWESEA